MIIKEILRELRVRYDATLANTENGFQLCRTFSFHFFFAAISLERTITTEYERNLDASR